MCGQRLAGLRVVVRQGGIDQCLQRCQLALLLAERLTLLVSRLLGLLVSRLGITEALLPLLALALERGSALVGLGQPSVMLGVLRAQGGHVGQLAALLAAALAFGLKAGNSLLQITQLIPAAVGIAAGFAPAIFGIAPLLLGGLRGGAGRR